jgi:hypothetical protein
MEPNRTGIQERLVLLVHLRKQKQRFLETQVIAMTGRTAENQKAVKAVMDSYYRSLFPGLDEGKKDTTEADARKLLAEEAQKVYLINPHGGGAQKSLNRALKSTNPEMRKWAAHEAHKNRVKDQAVHSRLQKARRNLDAKTEK